MNTDQGRTELRDPVGVAALLVRLAAMHGVRVDADEALRRLEDLPATTTWTDAWLAAAPAVGLRALVVQRSCAALAAEGGRIVPALVDARGAPLLIGEARGARVRAYGGSDDIDGVWCTAEELAARIGVGANDALSVVVFEPALPLAALAAAEGVHGHGTHATPWTRLRALVSLEFRDLVAVCVYGIVVGLVALVTPLAVQALVNTVSFGALLQPLVVLAAIVVGALLVAGALRALQVVVVEFMQRRVFVRLVADLAHRLPRVAWAELTQVDGSKLVNRFFDVLTVQKAAAQLLLEGVALVLEVCVGLLVLAFYSPALLAFSALLIVGIAFVVVGLGRGAVTTSVDESYAKHDVAGWLEELVRHPTAFRTAHARSLASARADALARRYLAARHGHFRVLLRQSIGAYALQALASAALLGVGGTLVVRGSLTVGQLVAAELIVSGVVAGLAKLGKQLEAAYDLLAALDKIGHLVEMNTERVDGEGVLAREGPLSLHAHDLVVNTTRGCIVQGVSVAIAAGERVAVQGRGARELLETFATLREPDAGRLSIGGTDVRHLALGSVRARIAIARGVEIFEGGIAENLRCGRVQDMTHDLVNALRMAGLEDAVLGLPDALKTHLLPGGAPLHDDEAHCLMLARAVLGRPGLLLVDGTLDALSAHDRARVMDRLCAPDTPWTLVVTSRHDDVIARCGRVVQLSAQASVAVAPVAPVAPVHDVTQAAGGAP